MKVLFLDIDGVLNSEKRFSTQLSKRKGTYVLCPILCGRLIEFVEKHDIKIVLSSTWRLHEDHVLFLRQAGVLDNDHEDWRTKDLHGFNRADEVLEWIGRHESEIEKFAIIDDHENGFNYSWLVDKFVQTNEAEGVQPRHIERLAEIYGVPYTT